MFPSLHILYIRHIIFEDFGMTDQIYRDALYIFLHLSSNCHLEYSNILMLAL